MINKALIVLVFIIFSGLSAIAQNACSRLIENEFSLCTPSGWTISEKDKKGFHEIRGPGKNGYCPSIHFDVFLSKLPLSEFINNEVNVIIKSSEKDGIPLNTLESLSEFTAGSLKGIKIVINRKSNPSDLKSNLYCFDGFLTRKVCMVGIGHYSEKDFLDQAFDEAAKSFKLIKSSDKIH